MKSILPILGAAFALFSATAAHDYVPHVGRDVVDLERRAATVPPVKVEVTTAPASIDFAGSRVPAPKFSPQGVEEVASTFSCGTYIKNTNIVGAAVTSTPQSGIVARAQTCRAYYIYVEFTVYFWSPTGAATSRQNGYITRAQSQFNFVLSKLNYRYVTTQESFNRINVVTGSDASYRSNEVRGVNHAINPTRLYIYSVNNVGTAADGSQAAGWSTFPWNARGSSKVYDGIYFNHRTLPGGAGYKKTSPSHEAGHWLGLYHTFETAEDGGATCGTKGDLVDDTPKWTLSTLAASNSCPAYGQALAGQKAAS
ncbi:hypothetical protein MNV49_001240 [Pseudohyphozyma bogoriensis]|nr:hypothetical protein MNV49_001240 [Pseudohyphozyma bogoriensis]